MANEDVKKDTVVSEGNQHVTFMLGDEEYGIEALKVQEIIGMPQITKVPYLPAFIKGVINLRGTVVPIFDLRLKFGFEPRDYTYHTCVIVTNVARRVVGMIVDSVSEVIQLSGTSIDPPPPFGNRINTDFMKGIGKIDKRLLILLDVERILTDEEVAHLEMMTAQMSGE